MYSFVTQYLLFQFLPLPVGSAVDPGPTGREHGLRDRDLPEVSHAARSPAELPEDGTSHLHPQRGTVIMMCRLCWYATMRNKQCAKFTQHFPAFCLFHSKYYNNNTTFTPFGMFLSCLKIIKNYIY